MRNPFKPKPKAPVVAPIKIAGIYTICDRLGLPKWYEPKGDAPRFVAEMSSGRDAIFKWAETEPAWNVDWSWHVFIFERYVADGETVQFVRYC